MSEIVNPKEMPHELLLRRNNVSITDLSSDAQQSKKDFDRTLRAVLSKSNNGEVKITSATKSKIDAYDRYICDGIFEFLEQEEINSKAETDIEKIKMDAEREEQMQKLEKSEIPPNQVVDNNQKEVVKDKARIGFFEWQ
jgi:hypothetical protein|tara:strand:+ start:73 stop:489 length:417 start_codon:yes stop_codon:yes gene_type:complete